MGMAGCPSKRGMVCHRCDDWWSGGDALFRHVENVQKRLTAGYRSKAAAAAAAAAEARWGRVLDAGIGYTSLRWLRELGAGVESCTGVTADRRMLRAMVGGGK